jgi:hypothetical protein
LALLLSKPSRQTRNIENPMVKYKKIQTGPKTEFGGEKNGFSRPAYQVDTDCLVNKDPTIPAPWHRSTLIVSLNAFFILYFLNRILNNREVFVQFHLLPPFGLLFLKILHLYSAPDSGISLKRSPSDDFIILVCIEHLKCFFIRFLQR